MNFTGEDKLKALAIVHIFETSRSFGNYAACAVLDDGAGISYGISQFTHRSGSLLAVVEEYLRNRGPVAVKELEACLTVLRRSDPASINKLATNFIFRKALRQAAETTEMRSAANKIASERYLSPAIDFCVSNGFTLPLSLAVIFDSITHGSFERIATTVNAARPRYNSIREKIWIREYVEKRDRWLASIPRLRVTTCRTRFFLHEIGRGNWGISLPLIVHGLSLTNEVLGINEATSKTNSVQQFPAVGPTAENPNSPASTPRTGVPLHPLDNPAETELAQPPVSDAGGKSVIDSAGENLNSTREILDSAGGLAVTIRSGADSVKSLWAVVSGTVIQLAWGIMGFFIGLPREVWIVVAVAAAALMLLYLYRQIEMGRIREAKNGTPSPDL